MATTTTNRDKQQIIVLGAGYGGLLAALRLAPYARVTLIDPSDHFTERVRQHELVARPAGAALALADLLRGTGVRHIPSRASALDPVGRQVTTDDGQRLGYDRLVYALGSRTAVPMDHTALPDAPGVHPDSVPRVSTGSSEHPLRVYTAESAGALRLRTQSGKGALTVVGGGLTGIELAAELAESRPAWDIRLLTAGPLAAGQSARGRDHVRGALEAQGVRIEEGRKVEDPAGVDADVVVWAASMRPNVGLAADAGLALDPESGRIAVDAALRSITHPEISAVGDAAAAHSPLGAPSAWVVRQRFPPASTRPPPSSPRSTIENRNHCTSAI
ncbi:NAD(P)/FAD-dependent oxidoreductase [Streptomyces albipurpureus]|uniref:NAD(P)/FAD-dependent oxidoreductase n=1 Tax=Streptomyces albipurpureus TaxID=2897419 RepID=UPI0027E4A924|nr:FAD-dependent oxidoreductase [Streptomyces sp. CWNU-1]